ncbi:MAG: hypothetical protein U1G07_18730 [Verrucomicrobiota bacterium]
MLNRHLLKGACRALLQHRIPKSFVDNQHLLSAVRPANPHSNILVAAPSTERRLFRQFRRQEPNQPSPAYTAQNKKQFFRIKRKPTMPMMLEVQEMARSC